MPQQAEADGVLITVMVVVVVVAVVLMLMMVPQLVLDNPGRRYEAETADGHQSGGQQHPKAAHAAEHAGSVGRKARRPNQIVANSGVFLFLFPAQE